LKESTELISSGCKEAIGSFIFFLFCLAPETLGLKRERAGSTGAFLENKDAIEMKEYFTFFSLKSFCKILCSFFAPLVGFSFFTRASLFFLGAKKRGEVNI
jgi:hypothetical protein